MSLKLFSSLVFLSAMPLHSRLCNPVYVCMYSSPVTMIHVCGFNETTVHNCHRNCFGTPVFSLPATILPTISTNKPLQLRFAPSSFPLPGDTRVKRFAAMERRLLARRGKTRNEKIHGFEKRRFTFNDRWIISTR